MLPKQQDENYEDDDGEEEDPVELPYDNETPLIREDVDSLTVPQPNSSCACVETQSIGTSSW
jgi:hypothetical protein